MKRSLFVTALGLLCCSPLLAAESDTIVVENAHVRLVFGSDPVPTLQQIVHKPSDTSLLDQDASQSLFRLEIADPKTGNTHVESQKAKSGSIKVTPFDGGHHITIDYLGLGSAGDLGVQIDGRLNDTEPFVRWSIAVDNPAQQRITAVRFPCVAAVPEIGSPEDDFIVAPALPGAMIEQPAVQWPASYSLQWPFPGSQSVQFCTYQDRTAGVYLASMDTVGWPRALQIAKQNDRRYILLQEYRLPEVPGKQWQSPYEVALGVTSGTWQHSADLYKQWATQQSWCARRLSQREDIPDWWKRSPCIYTIEVRTYDKERLCDGSYYASLPENVRQLSDKIGGPVVPMLAGWENHRRWTAGDYFPLFDESAANAAITELRKDGFSPFVFLSGLYYTFENEGRDGGTVPGADRYFDSFVVEKGTGKPKPAVLNESSGRNTWKRHSYAFCPAASQTEEFFRSVIKQLHDLGINIVQMDQTTSGAGGECYSTEHGHVPGPGPYQAVAFRELLTHLREYGQSLSPEFVLFHEEPHEQLIPCLDGFHTREYKERFWYRGPRGARGIPLFTYLYHEYAIAYGGDSAGVSTTKNANMVRQHAVNLVTGKTPGIAVWSNQKAVAEAHADQIRMVRNHCQLLQTEAQKFLILGRMLHSLELDVPSVSVPIPARRDGKWRTEPFEERAVLTSSWQSPEGFVGHCLVNITDEEQSVHLTLDTRNAPSWPKADIDLLRAGASEKTENVGRRLVLPYEHTLVLEPLEAVFLIMRPAN